MSLVLTGECYLLTNQIVSVFFTCEKAFYYVVNFLGCC